MTRPDASDEKADSSGSRLDRRAFITAAGAVAASSLGVGAVTFGESQAAVQGRWDREADVIVVGSGCAAMTGAVIAAAEGLNVLMVESSPFPGGASARSGAGFWIPNNRFLRARGLTDPREWCIRYMARYSFTQLYDQEANFYNIPENSYHLMEAMYDNASPAVERLEALGAAQFVGDKSWDYWDYCPQNKCPEGRLIWFTPKEGRGFELGGMKIKLGGGHGFIQQMKGWLDQHGVSILLEHRATRLVVNSKREVVGLEVLNIEGGKTLAMRARKAVQFGSGGFILNRELNLNFQRGPVFGACGPMTNQGDFVYMATEIGAKLGNMQNGWRYQLVLDQALQTPALATDMWGVPGDSMFLVSKYGKRVVDEKRPYNDRGEVHFVYDPNREEWQNLVLFMIFDQRVMDLCAQHYPIPPKDTFAPYILRGSNFEELTAAISEHLTKFAPKIGGFHLDPSFLPNLKETVGRFNQFADTGSDLDFNRGGCRYDVEWNARFGGEASVQANDKPNKTMYPIAAKGPYYAILVVAGSADSNGGPVINANAQVLSNRDRPIAGLYGAGNCIAAPSGRAYWGGGQRWVPH
jgi:3-oxosteroid 1-dehydrogenase